MSEDMKNDTEGTEKKKQKPGLNAVRPRDYVEIKFKELAKDNNLSQTEMFEHMFWAFTRQERENEQEDALSLDSEVRLISENLNSILLHFKSIAAKAQDTLIAERTNAIQAQKNQEISIDTLEKQITEITKRNNELEQSNSAFTTIKEGLERQVWELKEQLNKNNLEFKEIKEKVLKYQDDAEDLKISNHRLTKENEKIKETYIIAEKKAILLETANTALQAVINNFEALKKAEIQAIEGKSKAQMKELQSRLLVFEEAKKKEFESFEKAMKIRLEAEKKIAIADIKLELVDAKIKYQETLAGLNR